MSSWLETATRLYLVASQMDTDLAAQARMCITGSLEGFEREKRRVSKDLATGADRLARSAWIHLVRFYDDYATAGASMARRHPCNTARQIDAAVRAAGAELDAQDAREEELKLSTRCDLGYRRHGADPVWSDDITKTYCAHEEIASMRLPYSDAGYRLARICDVPPERTDVAFEHYICGMGRERDLQNIRDSPATRAGLAGFARIQLVRADDDRYARDKIKGFYPEFSADDAGRAIAEARQSLRAEADGIRDSELERFAWIQSVCGLFGRTDIRGWTASEYPYVGRDRIDRAIKNARDRLLGDIADAGPVVLTPAAAHRIIMAHGDIQKAREAAAQMWDYLGDDVIDGAFEF